MNQGRTTKAEGRQSNETVLADAGDAIIRHYLSQLCELAELWADGTVEPKSPAARRINALKRQLEVRNMNELRAAFEGIRRQALGIDDSTPGESQAARVEETVSATSQIDSPSVNGVSEAKSAQPQAAEAATSTDESEPESSPTVHEETARGRGHSTPSPGPFPASRDGEYARSACSLPSFTGGDSEGGGGRSPPICDKLISRKGAKTQIWLSSRERRVPP